MLDSYLVVLASHKLIAADQNLKSHERIALKLTAEAVLLELRVEITGAGPPFTLLT